MTGRLDNKVAFVTGAGRGIGEAIARAFHRENAKVMVTDLAEDSARGVARSLADGRPDARHAACDVTSPASIHAAVARTVEAYGRIDILVNNAGINVFHDPLETTDEEWRRCFEVDLDGVWRMSRAVLPHMLDQGAGSIVNIASSHSFSIIPGCFPYPVAKHGLLGLTRALGIDYARRGIRVNAIAPGYVETQLAIDYWNGFPDPQAERRRVCDMHPPGRICSPEEVAMTALFLASDEAPFINAACIVIDGGRSVLYHE